MSGEAGPIVALVDDDDDLRAATAQLLTLHGMIVRPFADGAAALAAIGADFAGVVVTDVRMPGLSGIDLFRALHARDGDLPVLLVTGHGDIPMAVDAIRAGAWDFLSKPFDPDALVAAVVRAGRSRALVMENRRLRALAQEQGADAGGGEALIGDTPAIRRLRGMIPMLADASLDLVIEGEVGTGREHYARLVHRAGRRGRHRFLLIDCATVPPAVAERELFARHGPIERAARGTLFLANLHAAGADLQHRLARFAETRLLAFDSRDPQPVDVRIVAALDEGARDAVMPALFHLLAGVPLRLPPLAERAADVPLLLAHFLARAAHEHDVPVPALADHAARLAGQAWPGNVLELERAAERIVLGLESADGGDAPASLPLSARLDAFERAAIIDAVAAADGEMSAAIERLQLPRKTFYYRVKRLGIDLRAVRRDLRGR